MEDDYQKTLKGKIHILFQLEKWLDVKKLCAQYSEKYGIDTEVDMIRFQSERRLAKSAAAEAGKPKDTATESHLRQTFKPTRISEAQDEEEQPLLLTADIETEKAPAEDDVRPSAENPDYEPFPQVNELILTDPFAPNEPLPAGDKLDYEPFIQGNELIITEPFVENEPPQGADEPMIVDASAENEPVLSLDYNDPPLAANTLVVGDPFAGDKPEPVHAPPQPAADAGDPVIDGPVTENEPQFILAGNEPAVILDETAKAESIETPRDARDEEISIVDEFRGQPDGTESTFASTQEPAKAFEVEPLLDPAAQAKADGAVPVREEEKKPPVEILDSSSIFVDKPSEIWQEPSSAPVAERSEEKPAPMRDSDANFQKKPKSPRKIVFNFKYLLVLVLPLTAAVVLWLTLSGKLTLDGDAAMKDVPAAIREPQTSTARRPARKAPPAVQTPKIDEKEQLVDEKILLAEKLFKNGDVLNALALVLEAKKIKITEPLNQLEAQIRNKIRDDESNASAQKQMELQKVQSEDQAFAKADAENTIAAWQNFLGLYPQSAFAARARNKIIALEQDAAKQVEQELQARIRQAKKLTLRSAYLDLNQAELDAALQQLGKPSVQLEPLQRGSERVVIDFSSGLMWILWNKPMAFDKASWWANRLYAGYSGWRLPTAEECQSLRRMDAALYAGLADFAVWTGDRVSDRPRSVWVLKLPQGQFSPEDNSLAYYVWAVRKAVK